MVGLNRRERRTAKANRITATPEEEIQVAGLTKEQYITLLEPIVGGLITGQKKLVIKSKAKRDKVDPQLVHYTHTFQVDDIS